LIDLVDD